MKKIIVTILSVFLVSCSNIDSNLGYIGEEAAKTISVEDVGLTLAEVLFDTIELDSKNGVNYYKAVFSNNGISYDYAVDAYTGKIISKSDKKVFSDENNYIGEEKAKLIALQHAGINESEVTITKNKLELDDGIYKYEIEFYTSDYKEYDYDINAVSGEIISFDIDAKNQNINESNNSDVKISANDTKKQNTNQPNNSNAKISADDAKNIALKQVPGANISHIVEFETDYENGKIEYEGEIIFNNVKYEFSIDGYSGFIRSWESENVDYDD